MIKKAVGAVGLLVAGLLAAVMVQGSSPSSAAFDAYAACNQSVAEALQSNRIIGKHQSYASDNKIESAAVFAYLQGGSRPSTTGYTHMGLHLVEEKDVCVSLAPTTTTSTTTSSSTTSSTTSTTTTTIPPVSSELFHPGAAGTTQAFVDSNGQSVTINGFNLQPVYSGGMTDSVSVAHLQQLKSAGFNAARFILFWENMEPSKGQFAHLADLDQAIANAKTAGIYVILEMIDNSQNFNHIPAWAQTGADPMADVIANGQGLITSLTARYANEPQVIAYDPINEPRQSTANNTRDLQMYSTILSWIRPIDPDKIVQIEPTWGSSSFSNVCANWSVLSGQPNLEIQVHDYYGGGGTGNNGWNGCVVDGMQMWDSNASYPASVPNQLAAHLDQYLQQGAQAGLPVMIGEYSDNDGITGHDNWIVDKVSVFNAYNISRIWWELHTSNPNSATDSSWNFFPWVGIIAAASGGGGTTSTTTTTTTTVPTTTTTTTTSSTTTTTPPPPNGIEHVVWVVMENHSYSQIIGNSSSAPYINQLATTYGLATNMVAESHPSLPNYIAMTSGSTQGITDDSGPSSHQLNVANIFQQLPGGQSRSLEESMTSNCLKSDSGNYAVRHNAGVYYTNLGSDCGNYDVPLGGTPDLSAKFTFITPNVCHDMHSNSCAGNGNVILQGDQFLQGFVPQLLNSSQYQAGNTVIFVTWDENEGSSGNQIPTIVIYPSIHGLRVNTSYNHYSMLRTVENIFNLPCISGACSASDMRPGFNLP